MFLVGILSWWYGGGWLARVHIMRERLAASADFFSIGLLVATLFAPFRQISANKVGGSLANEMRGFFDTLLSRVIGALLRLFMIVFGLVAMLLQVIFGAMILLFWLIIPLFPVIGFIGLAIGWVPQWLN